MAVRPTFSRTSTSGRRPAQRGALQTVAAVAGISALLLGVSACGSDEDAAPSSATVTSPLMDAILLGGSAYAEFETTQLAGYHSALQACMQDAGFEYTVLPAYQVNQQVDKDELVSTASAEGYGIASETDGISFAEDDSTMRLFIYPVTPAESDKREQEFQAAEAKNEEYLESLDDERAAEYDLVRNGDLTEDSFEVDEDGNLVQSESGNDAIDESCEAQASQWLADPGVDVLDSEEFTATYDKIMEFYDSVDSDESISSIYQEWSKCLAAATNETFALPEDITTALSSELEAAYGELETLDTDEESLDLSDMLEEDAESSEEELNLDSSDITIEDGEETSSEDDLVLEDETYEDYEVDEAALAALTEREVALATADVNCRFEIDFFNRVQNAQIELEKKFVAENKDELTKLATAIREARESAA